MLNENPTRSAKGQLALERKYVLSDEVYSQETNGIFADRWIYVCHESELSQSSGCRPLQVNGRNLVLIRGEDQQIRAFHNFCRHRGSELVTAENCDAISHRIQCPYHAWTYDREGRLVAAPNMMEQAEETGFDKSEFGLKEVACSVWHGLIFIRLAKRNQGNQSLTEFMAPLESHAKAWNFSSLRVAVEIEYDVDANWKLLFQNYNECYHCPTVHPALNRLTPFKGASNDIGEGPILGGPMMLSQDSETMSNDGKHVGTPFPNLDETQKRSVAYYTIFPSLFLSAHPDYVLIHRIVREGVNKTRVVCQFLFLPETISSKGFDPTRAVEFWDLTNKQDWEVCELAHRGITNVEYEPGPYSDLESVVAAFDRYYMLALAE